MLETNVLKSLHNQSLRNRENLLEVKEATCFYCENVFKVSKITEWVDEENTALCPHCNIDSVIPKTKEVTPAIISEMKDFWFGNVFEDKTAVQDKKSEQKQ